MSSLLTLLVRSASLHRPAMSAARQALPLCTAASKAKPASAGKSARQLSPACRQHLDKFLATVGSLDKTSGGAAAYRNPEYFVFDGVSFYDYEMAMESKRLPQPESKLTAF